MATDGLKWVLAGTNLDDTSPSHMAEEVVALRRMLAAVLSFFEDSVYVPQCTLDEAAQWKVHYENPTSHYGFHILRLEKDQKPLRLEEQVTQ